jgi:membrane associated rhomboid family serine protease
MPRSTAMTMSLPPFSGTVRQLIIANVAVFFLFALLGWLTPGLAAILTAHLMLQPIAVLHGQIWQLVTYSFLNPGLLGILFAMLTLWFCGVLLEGAYGSRWLAELYFVSAIGGAILATVLSFTNVLHLSPLDGATGAWAGLFGIMMGLAMRMGDQEFLLFFLVSIRAKYMVAIYILIDVAVLLKNADTFNALLELSGTLCGYLYVRYAPRRGLAFSFSEQYFGIRNSWYRAKRRRAARKFEVYMSKQGRQVHFDKDGRYLDPDEERKNPNDKRWMN